ncbi:MAG: acetyl-CoA carboxylase biotin carboxylase subunit [Phycisphaerae bacterium]|nr:acetyl-CoA carboxylase biotin carboxylase subunit [Phycisphaerae bacterium]
MFSRILIANRGEIALRIIRACKELGVETVVVYSEADRDAAYLHLADRAICIGKASPSDSYLNIPRIISAAEVANVEAIHPGYGFLAENPHFAEICRQCKIEFIGPTVEAMQLLGDKVAARNVAKKAGVTTVPGSAEPLSNEDEAIQLAAKIGYPVMIKAAAGGGGRGMRVTHNEANLRSNFKSAQAEAEAAFKDGRLYLEKFIEQPRHVEVQVLADRFGNIIHLWERDCTLQRRHQKLVEETPSPAIDEKTRDPMCKAAVKLAKAARYTSAGTFEFLVDKRKHFYFIEANTRIQVEHPVTEMVTGIDLIKWQIRIAAGEELSIRQRDVRQNGAAMECRINAENAAKGFVPCPGKIEFFVTPGGFGVRLDTHAYAGYTISPYYDSLVGKLIVHGENREEVIKTMRRALQEFRIGPIHTTIPFHLDILEHRDFVRGKIDTGFVDRL